MTTAMKPAPKSTSVVGFFVKEPQSRNATGISSTQWNLNMALSDASSAAESLLTTAGVSGEFMPMKT